MAAAAAAFFFALLASFFRLPACSATSSAAPRIGFCYGRNGDNLPPPSKVSQLVLHESIGKIRIYDYNATVLAAFAATDVDLTVTIPNEELASFASAESAADQWASGVAAVAIAASVKLTAVSVGVEVAELAPSAAKYVLPAMQNIHTGLTKAGLADKVKVSTALSMAALKQPSFPPSAAAFADSGYIKPILDFLKATGSYVMVNAHPYHAFVLEKGAVALDYALFQPKQPVIDAATNLSYGGLLWAQLDAVYFALEAAGHRELVVVVSEAGWPSRGDADETAATAANAAAFNNHLIELAANGTGSPHRPGNPLVAFVFSLFDEDLKTGKSSEKNWGVFDVSKLSSFYYLDVNGTEAGTPESSNGTGATWCVASPTAGNASLAVGLNFACGDGGADCQPIQAGQPCFLPDTYVSHASYAYNSYYQRSGNNPAACDFGGTATITSSDPSYGSCVFPSDAVSSSSSGTSTSSINGTFTATTTSSAPRLRRRWEFVAFANAWVVADLAFCFFFFFVFV